jgi:hypothetical protein
VLAAALAAMSTGRERIGRGKSGRDEDQAKGSEGKRPVQRHGDILKDAAAQAAWTHA